MKTSRLTNILMVVTFLIVIDCPKATFAQAEPAVNHVADFDKWTRELEKELLANDANGIAARFDNKATIVWQNGTYSQGAEGLQSFLNATLKGTDSVVTAIQNNRFEVDQERQQYGETIIAHGKLDQTLVLQSGREVELKCTWTATVMRTKNQWKIVSLQLAENVFENSILKTTRMWLLAAGIVGSLLGFSLGWFFTWFVTRSAARLRENRTLEY